MDHLEAQVQDEQLYEPLQGVSGIINFARVTREL